MAAVDLIGGLARLRAAGLRELRLERLLSQRELADLAGVVAKTVLDIERRRFPSI